MSTHEFAITQPDRFDSPRWWNPRIAHAGSLVVGVAFILIIARTQWFFGDDWAILAPHLDSSVMLPHVGHWNLIPALAFMALRNTVGLASYVPYLGLALLAHVAVVHLVWRILGRVGVQPWLATAFATMLLLFGGGAENILWAFQFGFMGAIALGLAVVVLMDDPARAIRPRSVVLIVFLSVLAPMFSGTAIPVLVAAGVLGWIRRGVPRTLLLLLPAAAVYLSWYLLVARSTTLPAPGFTGPGDIGKALVYGAAMVGGGLGRALPFVGLGVIPALAILWWVIVEIRRRRVSGPAAPAFALLVGAVAFVALTTYSRMDHGLSSAGAQRYAYLTLALLLPAVALIVTAIAARSRTAFIVSAAVVCALVCWNAVVLSVEATVQATREAGSRHRIERDVATLQAHPDDATLLTRPADGRWAPDLLGSDLLALVQRGLEP